MFVVFSKINYLAFTKKSSCLLTTHKMNGRTGKVKIATKSSSSTLTYFSVATICLRVYSQTGSRPDLD